MDVNAIIDLRYEEDIVESSDRTGFNPNLNYINLPIFTKEDAPMSRMDFLFRRDRLLEIQAAGDRMLFDEKTEVIADIFNQLADTNNIPVYYTLQ